MESHRPELRSWTIEFKCNTKLSAGQVLDAYHSAAFLRVCFRIDQNHRLAGQNFHFQLEQTTVSVHGDRPHLFLYGLAFSRLRHDNQWHAQLHALASSLFMSPLGVQMILPFLTCA